MSAILLDNGFLFDGISEDIKPVSVLVEGEKITALFNSTARALEEIRLAAGVRRYDLNGKFLMPGLIDAHFHCHSYTLDMRKLEESYPSYAYLQAGKLLNETLLRGFTTVRDTGGADIGLVKALEEGVISGPRLIISGRPLSQTGGHGDLRLADRLSLCNCAQDSSIVLVVDGEDAVRKAAREELRRGAHFLKIFVSGGVVSPTDPISMPQFTEREIRAVVEEAATRNTYVAAHSHTADSARRCVEYGIRTIEHGTLIDRETAELIADSRTYVVPTLSIMDAILSETKQLPAQTIEKAQQVADQAYQALEYCSQAGVALGFGTDLFGHLHGRENQEFVLRARVNQPIEVLRSATSINGEILEPGGGLGAVRKDGYADLLVVNGNPLEDISLMSNPEENFQLIIKQGEVIKDILSSDNFENSRQVSYAYRY